MITYDNPLRLSYHFNQISFAAANVTRLIAVPIMENGRKPGGQVRGALLHNITTVFAGATTDASIQVGISGDIDKYYESRLLETDAVGTTAWLNNTDTAAVDIEGGRTDITVTFVAGTGTPTGVADVSLFIDWY